MYMHNGSHHPCKSFIVLLIALVSGCACGCEKTAESRQAATADNPSPSQRREGEIRIADQRKRVVPYIMHRAEMDLYVQCRLFADSSKEKGKSPGLCYQADTRQQIKRLRIEHHESLQISEFLSFLRSSGECTHFIVDVTGTLYQTLDLAYPCRRDGAYRSGELRVLSGQKAGHQKLKDALSELFPVLNVEETSFKRREELHDK
jgi:hypothetical protein